jgi:hypothetical protein
METIAYLAFVLVAMVLGGILGGVAHFLRSLRPVPEDLGLGETISTLTRDNYQFEKHVIGAEWDDNGYWDGGSPRNFIYYVASGALVPLLAGLALWDHHATAVAFACGKLTSLGLHPLLCP